MSNFINPYNFIPLVDEKAVYKKEENAKLYSGFIQYRLKTKTPLFIPNTSNEDAFQIKIPNDDNSEENKETNQHKSYDFFSYEDLSKKTESVKDEYYEPVIPGSEMRGMIRSNFEILTNSCMSFYDDKIVLSKRTSEVFMPGLIKKVAEGTYSLWKANDHLLRTGEANDLTPDETSWKKYREADEAYGKKCYIQSALLEGQRVSFDSRNNYPGKEIVTSINSGRKTGYVIKGEDGPEMKDKKTKLPKKNQKHCCHIFSVTNTVVCNNPDRMKQALRSLEAVLIAYKENEDRYKEYNRRWNDFKKNGKTGEFFPVYYSSADPANSYYMLSPASITREIYRTKMNDLLETHISCNNENGLCPACALFGTIGKTSNNQSFQITSRLRFSDLHLTEKDKEQFDTDKGSLFEKVTTLKPLGEPKLNNTEFYLKRPEDAWFWTYDYYIDRKGNIHFNSPMINGRKFYWHNMKPEYEDKIPSKLNTTIRPLKNNITFEGKVYFENLSKSELDALIYTLRAGDDEEIDQKKHGYKLGHGKPLGLGSVAVETMKIVYTEWIKDEVNKTIELQEKEYDTYTKDGNSLLIKDIANFDKMTDFNSVIGYISYPIPSKPEEDGTLPVFKWFVENHLGCGRKDRNPKPNTMINTRKQMVFNEYMEAMEPKLCKIDFNNESAGNEGNNNGKNNNNQSGEIKDVVITGISRNNSIFFMDEGKSGTVNGKNLNGKTFSKGDIVRVKFDKEKKFDDKTVRFYRLCE